MNQKDYYKILGVAEDADFAEIKKAYRNLAFRYHPDRISGSEEMMKEINEAYAVLSNQAKRREYDALRHRYGAYAREQFRQSHTDQDIFRDSDIGQIFEEFSRIFGYSRPEDIFSGRNFYGNHYRTFEFRSPGRFGKGFVFYVPPGNFYRDSRQGFGDQKQERQRDVPPRQAKFAAGLLGLLQRLAARKLGLELPERGKDLHDIISLTAGEASEGGKVGYLYRGKGQSRQLLITVPRGISAGRKIKLRGLGGEGINGGEPGDLYLQVRIRSRIIEGLIGRFNIGQAFILRVLASIIYTLAVFGGFLFIPAGTLQWPRAWIFLGVLVLCTMATMFGVFPGREELLRERFRSPIQKGQPLADKIILPAFVASFFGLLAFIPLDVFRYHIMGRPGAVISAAGLGMFVAGWAIISFAFMENPFAAPVIKHQQERHQRVIDTGVYGIVRHPMYTGGILLMLGMPLWLGSYAAMLLSVIPVGLIILRIFIEEGFLKKELAGYDAYMKKVRYRLFPFVW